MENKEGSNSKSLIPIPTGSSNSITPVPTPMPSPITIGSIQIDLSGYSALMQDKSTPCTCNHFSIRGYTAEMRKKNIKACLPFPTMEGDLNQSRNTLPPLEVPQFRYWKCQHCVSRMNILANVAASRVGDGQKDLQQGTMERGSGTNANSLNVDGIGNHIPFGAERTTIDHPLPQLNVNRADQNPTVSMDNRSFKEKKHGEIGCSLSSLIGNKEIHGYNSRFSYEKLAPLGSRRLPDFRTSSSFSLIDNNILKQKLQNSNGTGSSNSPKTGTTGVRMINTNREINPSVFLGEKVGLTGSTPGSSKQTEMRNLHHQLSNQSHNILMNVDKEVEVPLDLNRAAELSSYTCLLLGREPERNGMENSKRKRTNSDIDFSMQKTRLLTELMMDSDRKSPDFHGKDSGNAASAGSPSFSNSSSKELEASKNLLETFFKPPLVSTLGRKNLLCDLNKEMPLNFEMSNSNHQAQPHQQPRLDLSGGGASSSSRDQRTDKHTMDQMVELNAKNLPQKSSPEVRRNSGNVRTLGSFHETPIDGFNQSIIAASSNLYKNHYNIGQIAKNAAVSNFSKQRVAESTMQTSSPKGSSDGGNWSNPNSNGNSSSSNNNNNDNGQKEISPKKVEKKNNLSVFEKFTENPWIAKRFKIDLNKEAIDPSEAIPAMQLLSLKNATGFKMPSSSGFTFGSCSSYQKTKEPSSSSPDTPVINFGPEYLNGGGTRETISPFQRKEMMDFDHKEKQAKEVRVANGGNNTKKKGLNEGSGGEEEEEEEEEEDEEEEEGLAKSKRSGPSSKSICINDLCSVNRNPAEFTVLGVKNEYMINGKDLKFGKGKGKGKVAAPSRGKRARTRVIIDGRKRKKKDDVHRLR